jgi:DNA processing protein
MYQELLSEGGILTEYPMGMLPYRWNFPPRNRIISGLSDGVFVVEARNKSGSLITAELALEQGRDVFAMPGRAGDPLSLGTNRLIKQGAFLVDKPEDILDFYQIGHHKTNEKKDLLLETEEKIVYANLSLEEKHINRLVQETGMEIGKVMQILFRLEEKGLAGQTGQYFHLLLAKEKQL